MTNAAILLCAGNGKRMRGEVTDKILTPLAGVPVICHCVNAFIESNIVEQIVFVYRDVQQQAAIARALTSCKLDKYLIHWTQGGAERQDSVFNALIELSSRIDIACIHDCARPFIRPTMLRKLVYAAQCDQAATLAHRVTDTIKQAGSTQKTQKLTLKDVPRADLWAMETPQAFDRELITEAYRTIQFENLNITDDTAAASYQGHLITLVENPYPNPKLTTPSDLQYIEFLLTKFQKSCD